MPIKLSDGFEISSVIVCEDVRPEVHNKWSILGAFSGDIVVTKVPTPLRIALYCEGAVDRPYKSALYIRIRLDQTSLATISGEFEASAGGLSLPVPSVTLQCSTTGTLHFEASIDNEKWIELISKRLIVGNLAP